MRKFKNYSLTIIIFLLGIITSIYVMSELKIYNECVNKKQKKMSYWRYYIF